VVTRAHRADHHQRGVLKGGVYQGAAKGNDEGSGGDAKSPVTREKKKFLLETYQPNLNFMEHTTFCLAVV